MMTEQEITDELTHIGFTASEIPTVMRDVGEVIFATVFVRYPPSLSESERAKIISLSQEELQQYFKEHPHSLPLLSQEQFDAVHDETWRDYLKSMR